ncbi:putative N-alpha-acetyltransferase 60-like [Capsicum annuum]|uniref:translocon-associated protein subunit beta isoform X2 n=1 Tax=Capsicum annuum TaxID=4072 RepID=UPI0007BF97F7|nr:translocon-associated protein subunit beta isoform X2 [Capsicum annuum]KAF3675192.1 putative N-alpha-acetyltransferase 60-like [Capsicum annuum]
MATAALIIFTIVTLFAVSSLTASAETPFVVARKKASVLKLKSGAERVSVSIDIYNHGSLAIYDVSLADDSWSTDIFEFVAGNTSNSWEKLDAGSHVSHAFELESKEKTTYYSAPAVITYRIPTKSKLQVAYSTPIPALETLAEKAVAHKLDLKLLAKYGSHVSLVLIVALFVRIISSPSLKSSATNAKKRH